MPAGTTWPPGWACQWGEARGHAFRPEHGAMPSCVLHLRRRCTAMNPMQITNASPEEPSVVLKDVCLHFFGNQSWSALQHSTLVDHVQQSANDFPNFQWHGHGAGLHASTLTTPRVCVDRAMQAIRTKRTLNRSTVLVQPSLHALACLLPQLGKRPQPA